MKITPLDNQILIEIQEDKETESGIILTGDHIKENGKVLAIGNEVKNIKVGDKVLFKSWSIDRIEIDDKEIAFIREDLILAKVK